MATKAVPTDPLSMNFGLQTNFLLDQLDPESLHARALQNVSSREGLLRVLSQLLSTPGLTITIANAFRPILLDLSARFLESKANLIAKLEALCLLVGLHSEIYPVLSSLLHWPEFATGPFAVVQDAEIVGIPNSSDLHRTLLAYYRILHANRDIPQSFGWSLAPLSRLIWEPHPHTGVRLLAIQCYALQSGMVEGERITLERQVVGDMDKVDCPIEYGASVDGVPQIIDGWLLHVTEAARLVDARNALLLPQKYYTYENGQSIEPIKPAELSPLIANVHGVLMLRTSSVTAVDSNLISTPTTSQSLRILALHLSMGVPTLLTSSSSSGKSLLLSHLAATLYPTIRNQIITIHLSDTSLDPRSLLGSYVSSPTRPGTFDWKEGVLVRAMREGRWVVLEDIDRASNEVLGMIKPLAESLADNKWIGGRASMDVPGRGWIEAEESFKMFATRSLSPSRSGSFPTPSFYGAHIFHEVVVTSPTHADLRIIIDARYPRLAGAPAEGLISLWEAIRGLGSTSSTRDVGLRELEKLCSRVDLLLPASHDAMPIDSETQFPGLAEIFTNPTLREDIFSEARDVFFGAGATNTTARTYFDSVASTVAEHLGLSSERRDWILRDRTPEYTLEKDLNGSVSAVRLGRTRLVASQSNIDLHSPTRPFAMHKPAISLLSRIASAVSLGESILLTGETGTGKTSVITHLASLLRKPLISLNLSNQTESSDIVGGFKPIDARVPASELQQRFLDIFGGSFSRKKNAHFEESVRKAVQEGKWKRAVALWLEASRLARDRIRAKIAEDSRPEAEDGTPRKRRKVEHQGIGVPESSWIKFEQDVRAFEVQHVHGNGKFAFGFVEGPLVKALRRGYWILLDEVNLASPETLECVSSLLHGPSASITLTEQGSLEPVPRHPEFRLFACMNPATDVGKKDLPPNIRSRFTEIDVPPPDADKETLLSIISQYIGHCAVGDKGAIMDVAEFYTAVRTLADTRQLADGSNHRPHFSMRTLARALTFAADLAATYSLRRSLWEGCLMAFTMALDGPGAKVVTALAQKYILAGVRNVRSLLSREPTIQPPRTVDEFVKFGPFYLERGPYPEDNMDQYIMTPSVEAKLIDLARILVTRRFPVLIEGPTSSGKTSSIEYLAKRTGHRFIRINNHEHTDIQEYLGTYVSDPVTGKLVFKDGLLVRALRQGDWIVLDELNLAPTDVLEALNRLLDDNRELVIPETQEVIRPHPHFMLFATQNPPGLYAGRKILSRAFRNRFLEVHFDDVPQAELESILCQRCRIAPSYGQRIVTVFRELQNRRQTSRIFESRHGFATLRDLFRWAGRDAIDYQELANNGYMLLAERARRNEDKQVVKETIESVMKVRIDPARLYSLQQPGVDLSAYLGCPAPQSSRVVWTSAMQRLFILVARALRFDEPVLLVGETGSGKTSVCQLYSEIVSKTLHSINCHQNTETADLIGGLRPIRNRASLQTSTLQHARAIVSSLGRPVDASSDAQSVLVLVDQLLKTELDESSRRELTDIRAKLPKLATMFEWHDGPLVDAMRLGDVFLMDEISLADDSVLERLNSVLESSRTIVLAERGGDDQDALSVQAAEGFKLVATMNPGGDYGKKELSPALRNRFTEIWVPPVDSRSDLELIVSSLWRHEALKDYTPLLLDFIEWLSTKVSDSSLAGLRDILAWVDFSNAAYCADHPEALTLNAIFHHAAHMTFLDGLGSLPQLSSYSAAALEKLKADAFAKLYELAPLPKDHSDEVVVQNPVDYVQLGSFSIPRGPLPVNPNPFSFDAPTTRDNVMRVVRACQLPKPILLEGSPGVGKTSLVSALANICGYQLRRINLSDQTDLVDLFGSDLPVEGGGPGEFAWKDAEFLRALQEGDWVLLDEMNLAPQAVLEGLNAVLDHRGTVYIPELDRSFTRHPSFRIFAAQNPLHQGGGRKGLPKSFLNRFTKVYVQELSSQDVLLVCRNLFPTLSVDLLRGMIDYTSRLNEEVMVKRTFGREGAPWEFNLRDVIRWGSLLQKGESPDTHPSLFLGTLFLQRFRTLEDRRMAAQLFRSVFLAYTDQDEVPLLEITPNFVRFGHAILPRQGCALGRRAGRILQSRLRELEAMAVCLRNGWLTILTGPRQSGKSTLVRLLAYLTGHSLREIPINSATDATDILGSFEEVDTRGQAIQSLERAASLLSQFAASHQGSRLVIAQELLASIRTLLAAWSAELYQTVRANTLKLLDDIRNVNPNDPLLHKDLMDSLEDVASVKQGTGRFEWVDGPLVKALRHGLWVCLDGANLCNPSVLDRLNSLCESDGTLVLNERGAVNGEVEIVKPHPNFRLFMCVDSHYGELSRAMRNRGVEIALPAVDNLEDKRRVMDYLRLPVSYATPATDLDTMHFTLETVRRATANTGSEVEVGSVWPSAMLLTEDTTSSSIADLVQVTKTSGSSSNEEAIAYFTSHAVAPSHLPLLNRLVNVDPERLAHTVFFVRSLAQSHPLATTCHFREEWSQQSSTPVELLMSQPMDLRISSRLTSHAHNPVEALIIPISLLLRVFVALQLSSRDTSTSNTSTGSALERSQANLRERIILTIEQLTRAIKEAARSVCDSINVKHDKAKETLNLVLQLLNYGTYLEEVGSRSLLDYSAVHVALRLLSESQSETRQTLSEVELRIQELTSLVSPSSGLGIAEIWGLLSSKSSVDHARLEKLWDAASALPYEKHLMRSDVFQLLALTALAQEPDEDHHSAQSLIGQIEQKLDVQEAEIRQQKRMEDPILLINELELLSAPDIYDQLSQSTIQAAEKIIAYGCLTPPSHLSRLVSYQHFIWAAQAEQPTASIVVDMQRQWLSALWELPSQVERSGPSLLLMPIALHGTMMDCDNGDQTLLNLRVYEDTLATRLRHIMTLSGPRSTRLTGIADLNLRCVVMLLSCFESSYDAEDFAEIRTLSNIGTNQVLPKLVACIERSRHPALRTAVQQHLRPALLRLHDAGQDIQFHIGEVWIAYARMMIDLFVPNTPIDPATFQRCAMKFYQKQTAALQAEIAMHRELESRTRGNGSSNGTIRYLEALIEDASAQMPTSTSRIPIRDDVGRLHTYWSEVQEFLSRVISVERIKAFLTAASSGDPAIVQLEHVIQESISAFCQRLTGIYKDFYDINSPILLALSGMRLGLRLITDSATRSSSQDHKTELVGTLLAFPSVSSVEGLRVDGSSTVVFDSSLDSLITKLSGISVEVYLSGSVQPFISQIERIYERAMGLWLIDRARTEEDEREANSLYRRKEEEGAVNEIAAEEEEFLALFPEFGDVLDDDPGDAGNRSQKRTLIQQSSTSRLFEIHQELFASSPASATTALSRYMDQRRLTLGELIDSHAAFWPESFDRKSLPFQTRLVHDRLASFNDVSKSSRPYDFYHDENVPEAKKAASLMQALSERLQDLILQWPDQMVLQHLKDRCDVVAQFSLRNPVAKILSALEQLLLNLEDWEMYANRDNNLKANKQDLIELIVNWRRLELSAWKGLLNSQAAAFAESTSDWWFRLYDAAIRGVVSTAQADKEDDETISSVDAFLNDLVPLLDDFMSSGPIGQFKTRLDLLRSMEKFADLLAKTRNDEYAGPLRRVHHILFSTRSYYAHFEPKVSGSLNGQRAVLEKDIQGYIKLASWKDVNVHALRQSAQKTHRHLYKIVRKFRDVLRQPVVALLQPSGTIVSLAKQVADADVTTFETSVPKDTTTFPSLPSTLGRPQHLVNLSTTYRNYSVLISERLLTFLDSHLPHSVESLADDIISTSKALAEIVVPSSVDATRRSKLQKNLLTRKRKAWSDFLKELKRAGLSANVKPEVLEQNRSQRWIREQPSIEAVGTASTITDRAEHYFHRLSGILAQLRASLSDHHADLSTRELQRALMHIESAYSLAIQSRSRLAKMVGELQEMMNVYRRLRHVSSNPQIVATGPTVTTYTSFVKTSSSYLTSALRELSDTLSQLQSDDSTVNIPVALTEAITSEASSLEAVSASLVDVWQNVTSSADAILLKSEQVKLEFALDQIAETAQILDRWCREAPHLDAFIRPVLDWLQAKEVPHLDSLVPRTEGSSSDHIIDSLLLRIQTMLKISTPAEEATEEEKKDYIRDDCRLLFTLSSKLELQSIAHCLQAFVAGLSGQSEEDIQNSIARLLPFLDRYISFANAQIVSQAGWTKSLFKLDYVLCSIVSSVAKDGFCQPKEAEEGEDDAGGQENGEGMGLGEGTGNENVSKEIQEESQVEGLQGEDTEGDDKVERAEEGNAIEMSEDFGGEMQDVPQEEGEEGDESEEESEGDPDEQLGELDGADENAVDEKLWGDEKGPEERDNGGKTDKDHSKQDSGESETVAKEGEQPKQDNDGSQRDKPETDETQDQETEEATDAMPEDDEVPGQDGAPLDDFTQEADTLDLPDSMELDGPEKQESAGEEIDDEDDLMNDEAQEEGPESGGPDGPPEDEPMDVEDEGMQQVMDEDAPEGQGAEDVTEDAVAQPDTHAGDGAANEDTSTGDAHGAEASGADQAEGSEQERSAGDAGTMPGESTQADENDSHEDVENKEAPETLQTEPNNQSSSSSGASGTQRGSSRAMPQKSVPLSANPLRSLGDALREISQRFNDILENQEGDTERQGAKPEADKTEPAQLEYMHEDETQDQMQALGPADKGNEAKLRDLNLIDEDEPIRDQVGPVEEDHPMDLEPSEPDAPKSTLQGEETSDALQSGVESALTPADIRARQSVGSGARKAADEAAEPLASDEHDDAETDVELALQQWQADDQPSDQAELMWRRYESLTHDLSYALCEQLRLILEPTMATRLKGDYRTGKRLNMKKIIPYIASEYTKDKIWLRRTRPSQREYQVLIALDDSKSMAESHSVHLAFQMLALVSKALSRLEVGDVAIAKFGKTVDVLHGFEGGPFTDQAGTKIMDAFKFNQQATQVQALLETSLTLLEQAREKRAMTSSSAADLWQMEIIISDGICQDHERLRSVLRKAEEQRVMVVFIILDSLHANNSSSGSGQLASQNSILSMNQVAYKEVDGRMDLTVSRYLDTFPFEYYAVVRDVEALPDVLSGTLKQFFERISEE